MRYDSTYEYKCEICLWFRGSFNGRGIAEDVVAAVESVFPDWIQVSMKSEIVALGIVVIATFCAALAPEFTGITTISHEVKHIKFAQANSISVSVQVIVINNQKVCNKSKDKQ
jgi:glutamate mutase epsilon subunit